MAPPLPMAVGTFAVGRICVSAVEGATVAADGAADAVGTRSAAATARPLDAATAVAERRVRWCMRDLRGDGRPTVPHGRGDVHAPAGAGTTIRVSGPASGPAPGPAPRTPQDSADDRVAP